MQTNLYVTLSAQMAMQRRLDTLAHNIANAATAGFRTEQITFQTILSETSSDQVAFSTPGTAYLSRASGPINKTDNPLDVAVQGEAWMAISTPAGQVYTRDGRFQMTETGELKSLNGHPILDVGGGPLTLDPNGGPPVISRDGMISQKGRQVGAIGLFTIPENAKMARYENSGVIPSIAATPVADPSTVGLAQGFIEKANVNPVIEMSRLIAVSRAFEAITNAMTDSERSLDSAIETLGG